MRWAASAAMGTFTSERKFGGPTRGAFAALAATRA